MKYKYIITILLFTNCSNRVYIKENRSTLKEYALCKCLQESISSNQEDISVSIYREISNYPNIVHDKIDSLIQYKKSEFNKLVLNDHAGKNSNIKNCISLINSSFVDSIIKLNDQILLKNKTSKF